MAEVQIKSDSMAEARAKVEEAQRDLELALQELTETKIVAVLLQLRSEAYTGHHACDDGEHFVLGHVFVHRMTLGDIVSSGRENFVVDESDGKVYRNWLTSSRADGKRAVGSEECVSGQPIGDNIYHGIDIVFTGEDAEDQAAAWLLKEHDLRMPTKIEVSVFRRDERGGLESISNVVIDMGTAEMKLSGLLGVGGRIYLERDRDLIRVCHCMGSRPPAEAFWYPLGAEGVEIDLQDKVLTIDLVDQK